MPSGDRAKANKNVQTEIDGIIGAYPDDKGLTSAYICSKINALTRKRSCSTSRISALLKQRKDIEYVNGVWVKIKVKGNV